MEVKVNSNFKKALRDIGNVPRKYVQKEMVTALNKVGAGVVTQAKRELKDATGLKAGVVAKKIKKDKARRGDETYLIFIKSRYLNVIEFGADKQRKVFLLKHGVNEKHIVVHLLEGVKTLVSNLSLKKGEVQNKSKQFTVHHYQESLNVKTWQRYLIRK